VIVMALLYAGTVKLGDILDTTAWHGLTGWIFFALSCAVTFFAALVVAFFAGLSGDQRQQILRRARVVLSISSE
jgi:hypothetical protein